MKSAKGIYLLMGPPGCGKGSLAQLCVQQLGWKQLSTGNLCRKHISEQTEIGKEIDFAIKSGKLVSDELVTAMVAEWLDKDAQDAPAVILDGYPRTRAQAQALDNLLSSKPGEWNLQVITFNVSDDTVVDRLSRRYICMDKKCQAVYSLEIADPLLGHEAAKCEICSSQLERRKDDEPAAIRDRLAIYHKHEDVLLQFYKDKGLKIKELNAEQPMLDVFRDFKQLIGM